MSVRRFFAEHDSNEIADLFALRRIEPPDAERIENAIASVGSRLIASIAGKAPHPMALLFDYDGTRKDAAEMTPEQEIANIRAGRSGK